MVTYVILFTKYFNFPLENTKSRICKTFFSILFVYIMTWSKTTDNLGELVFGHYKIDTDRKINTNPLQSHKFNKR